MVHPVAPANRVMIRVVSQSMKVFVIMAALVLLTAGLLGTLLVQRVIKCTVPEALTANTTLNEKCLCGFINFVGDDDKDGQTIIPLIRDSTGCVRWLSVPQPDVIVGRVEHASIRGGSYYFVILDEGPTFREVTFNEESAMLRVVDAWKGVNVEAINAVRVEFPHAYPNPDNQRSVYYIENNPTF